MKRILPPFVVSIASTQVVTRGGHSFLPSCASDVPALPALQEQYLELEFLTLKDETERTDGSL